MGARASKRLHARNAQLLVRTRKTTARVRVRVRASGRQAESVVLRHIRRVCLRFLVCDAAAAADAPQRFGVNN